MPDLARLRAAVQPHLGGSSDYDLNPKITLPPGRVLRPAAVLLAVSPTAQRSSRRRCSGPVCSARLGWRSVVV